MDDPAKKLEKYTNMFLNGKLEEEEYQILKKTIMAEINNSGHASNVSEQRKSTRLSQAQIRSEQTSAKIDNLISPQSSDFSGFSDLPLEELIGVGELARIFRMKDINGIDVAIKLIRSEYRSPQIINKIFPILQRVLQVQSEIIVSYLDFIAEPEPYIMMEYLDGAPFSVNDEPVPHEAVDFIFQKLLEGCIALHNQGIMHGDIKPSNVFLCRDARCKILDPMMWTILNSTESLQNQSWIGEITHMAPERFDGIESFATDIYAIGLLGWELLTGQKACPTGTQPNGEPIDWHTQENWHRNEPLLDPRTYQQNIPEWMIVCLHRFAHKDHRKRPQNANDALQLWLHGASGHTISLPSDQQSSYSTNRDYSQDHSVRFEDVKSKNNFQQSEFLNKSQESTTPPSNQILPLQKPSLQTHHSSRSRREQEEHDQIKDIQFRQHPIFERVLDMLAQQAKKYFTQDLNLPSIKAEGIVGEKIQISSNTYSEDTQIIAMSIYKLPYDHKEKHLHESPSRHFGLHDNDFTIYDVIGYILLPLDFIPKLIGWSMGAIDDHDESLQLSWIMRNFARQFIEKLFSPVYSHLKFVCFFGEPSLGIPSDQTVFLSAHLRIVGHTKISIFMLPHIFSTSSTENETIPLTKNTEEIFEELPVHLSVRTEKIRIPLHKFQNLQVGEMFPLPKNWLSQVIVSINNKDVFLGTYGESGEEKAVQLTQFISESKI